MQDNPNEIVLYQPDNSIRLEVRIENETVWLNRQQMSVLFDRDIKTIGKHINNALREELSEFSVVAKFATTATDGKTYKVEYYNLDVILSVGYRVKSQRGTQFRIWANRILKDYLLNGYVINQRIDRLEHKIVEHDQKFDLLIRTTLPQKEGIFYDGQIFDAYIFVTDLIKSAKKSVVLIDNYIDETVLLMLSKRQEKVSAEIYTRQISEQLRLDLAKHNAQYKAIQIKKSNAFHDRFLLVDHVVYHIGASFKDLRKKLFAFSRMEVKSAEILKLIENE